MQREIFSCQRRYWLVLAYPNNLKRISLNLLSINATSIGTKCVHFFYFIFFSLLDTYLNILIYAKIISCMFFFSLIDLHSAPEATVYYFLNSLNFAGMC